LVNETEGIATANLPPGVQPKSDAGVVIPNPDAELRKRGWRLEIIFLSVLVIALFVFVLLMV